MRPLTASVQITAIAAQCLSTSKTLFQGFLRLDAVQLHQSANRHRQTMCILAKPDKSGSSPTGCSAHVGLLHIDSHLPLCICCLCFQWWLFHYLDWTFHCHTQSNSIWSCQCYQLLTACVICSQHLTAAMPLGFRVILHLTSQADCKAVLSCFHMPWVESGSTLWYPLQLHSMLLMIWHMPNIFQHHFCFHQASSLDVSDWLDIAFLFVGDASWLGLSIFWYAGMIPWFQQTDSRTTNSTAGARLFVNN